MKHFSSIVCALLYIAVAMGQKSIFEKEQLNCNKLHSCYFVTCANPKDANMPKPCNSLIIYNYDSNRNVIDFTIITKGISNMQYVAVGLTSSGPSMGNASVVECVVNQNGAIKAYSSYNDKNYENHRQTQAEGLTFSRGDHKESTLNCQFSQSINRIVNDVHFNLKEPQFMLYATGDVRPGDQITKHTDKSSSPQAINLSVIQSTTIISLDRDVTKIKAHACLMIFAWVGFTSIGIIFARYYKHMWPNSKLFGLLYWFQAHRTLMVLNVSCVIIAFILIMVANKGWKLTGENPHPIVGLVTFILCLIQPCMALFRCKPDADNRYIFNWAHWFVGTCAHILSVATIFLGFQLAFKDRPEISEPLDGLMATFVIFHIGTEIVLDVHMCVVTKKKAAIIGSNKICTGALANRDLHLQDLSRNEPVPGLVSLPPGSKFKNILLLLYILVIIALTIAMVTIVAINYE